jgi:hypothetical protein
MKKDLLVALACLGAAVLVSQVKPLVANEPAQVTYQPVITKSATDSFLDLVLKNTNTQEARDLIQQLGDPFLLELQPLAVKLVDKLESEGNSREWSRKGSAALIAWSTEECQPLTKAGQKDFSNALVLASEAWKK